MAIDTINRTNIQALWRYMPGQPFNFAARAAVVGETPRQVSTLDVPEAWVAAPLRRLIRPFAEAASGAPNVGPELDIIDRGQFELVRAEDLRAVRFPNTFLCGVCNLFRGVRPGEHQPECREHGPMEQFQWAEVHECGHLGEVKPPLCGNKCRAGMRLFNSKSLSLSRWYWSCARCGTRSNVPVVRACAACRRGRVTVTRVPQTWVYYPQQITVLNPPTRNTYATLAHDQVHTAAIAQALGFLPPGLDGLRAASGADADPVAKVQALAATLGWQPGNPLYEQALAEAHSKADAAPAWRDQVDTLGLDEEHLDALGDECRQLSLARAATTLTVDDLTSAGGPLAASYATYRPLFDRYGLSEVTLLRQLPLAYVVAGYTRLSSRASAVNRSGATITARFRFFPAGRTGKFRMYGLRTETEGLLFQIDPLKIVEWLVCSGVVDDPAVTDAADAQRWLFRITDPIVDLFNPPANRISEGVLGLTHSFAHRAMKALAARCGLNVDSLAEFLFPSNGAFLIYANTRSEFILGGLEHVFRFDLPDALRELDAESRCVFDPPRRHHFGGACAACLHVSEVACARFNTVLNRNLLFGSLPQASDRAVPGEVQWCGYWTH